METQAEHTQTPWEVGSDPYTILTENRGLLAKTTHYWVDPESAKANAEFIVKACNNYQETRNLLSMALKELYTAGKLDSKAETKEQLLGVADEIDCFLLRTYDRAIDFYYEVAEDDETCKNPENLKNA